MTDRIKILHPIQDYNDNDRNFLTYDFGGYDELYVLREDGCLLRESYLPNGVEWERIPFTGDIVAFKLLNNELIAARLDFESGHLRRCRRCESELVPHPRFE